MLGTHTDIGSSSNNDTPLFPDDAFSTTAAINLFLWGWVFWDRIPLCLTPSRLKRREKKRNIVPVFSSDASCFFCKGWIARPWGTNDAKLSAANHVFPSLTSKAFISTKIWRDNGKYTICKNCCLDREAKENVTFKHTLPPSSPLVWVPGSLWQRRIVIKEGFDRWRHLSRC